MNLDTLRLLYLAVGPGIAIAVYIYYSDKWEPEPKKLVIKSFLLGGLAVFPSGYFEDVFQAALNLDPDQIGFGWKTLVFAYFGVAMIEELCKFLFLKAFIYDDQEFSEPFDGIVYGGVIGCGFATIENIIYVFSYGPSVGILRMITAVPGHAFGGIILGYFVGTAKFSPIPEKLFIKGLLWVIILHGTYDAAVFSQKEWSFYVFFGIGALAIYFGLRAKKELERHSKVLEFSKKTFSIIKKGKESGSLVLKDVRDCLAQGKIKPKDVLVDKETGRHKTVSQVIYGEIGLKRKALTKIPPRGQPLLQVFIFYGITFGFYLYFWFYRNCREIRNFKGQPINPEMRALGLFIFTIIPFFIYGTFLKSMGQISYGPSLEIILCFLIAGIEAGFIYSLILKLHNLMKKVIKASFNPVLIVLALFVLSSLRKIMPFQIKGYWLVESVLVLLQGAVLVVVQKDLNHFWKHEFKEWSAASKKHGQAK